jgi:hypothetical protein
MEINSTKETTSFIGRKGYGYSATGEVFWERWMQMNLAVQLKLATMKNLKTK